MTTYITPNAAQIPSTTSPASAPSQSPTSAPAQTKRQQPLSPFANAPAAKQTAAQRSYESDGFSLAQAMTTLGKVSQDALRTSSNLQRAASQNEIAAKTQGVNDQKAQIRGEQVSEMTKMAGAASGAVASSGMAYKGANMINGLRKPKAGETVEQSVSKQARQKSIGSGMDAVSRQISQPITQSFDLGDKMSGGAAQADHAKIALKQDDVDAEIAKATGEAAKQGVQQSQEAVKNVNSVTLEHLQRWAGVYSRI